MPKQKTKKTVSKRFKIGKNNKVFRAKQYGRHKRATKSKNRIRHYKKTVQLTGKQAKLVRSLVNNNL